MDSTQIIFRAVGVVRTDASDDDVRQKHEDSQSTIEVFTEFQEALEGLEGFSHIDSPTVNLSPTKSGKRFIFFSRPL